MPRPPRDDAPQLYGRRRGRPLRPSLKALLARALPRVCIALPPAGRRLDPRHLFTPPPDEVWLEIGFGGGEHLAVQAGAHPAVGFIGAEVFVKGIATLLREVEAHGLGNVRILQGDARPLLDVLDEAVLGRCFLLFPDPWPKARHHKRRFVRRETLDALAAALADDAELRLATDDPGYARWMLRELLAHPDFVWLARRPRDWLERPGDWPETRYEAKARAAGRRPVFLRFRRRPRGRPARRVEWLGNP